jgi:hypothetical protein
MAQFVCNGHWAVLSHDMGLLTMIEVNPELRFVPELRGYSIFVVGLSTVVAACCERLTLIAQNVVEARLNKMRNKKRLVAWVLLV